MRNLHYKKQEKLMIYNIPFSYSFIETVIKSIADDLLFGEKKKYFRPIVILRNKAELDLAYNILGDRGAEAGITFYTYDDLSKGKINKILSQAIDLFQDCEKQTRIITHTELLLLIDDAIEDYKAKDQTNLDSDKNSSLFTYFNSMQEPQDIEIDDLHSSILQTFYEYEQHNLTINDLDSYNSNEMFFAYIIEYIDRKLVMMNCTTEARLWRKLMDFLYTSQSKCKNTPIFIIAPSINFQHLYKFVVWLYQNSNCHIFIYGLNRDIELSDAWKSCARSSCQYGYLQLFNLLDIKVNDQVIKDLVPLRNRDLFLNAFVSFVETSKTKSNSRIKLTSSHLAIRQDQYIFDQVDSILRLIAKERYQTVNIVSDCQFLTSNIEYKIKNLSKLDQSSDRQLKLSTLPLRHYKEAKFLDILQLTLAYANAKNTEQNKTLLTILQSPHRTRQSNSIELVVAKFITDFIFFHCFEQPEKILELFACDMEDQELEGYRYLNGLITELRKWANLSADNHEIYRFWECHFAIVTSINTDLRKYNADIEINNDRQMILQSFAQEVQKLSGSLKRKISIRQYKLILNSALEMQPKQNTSSQSKVIEREQDFDFEVNLTSSYSIENFHTEESSLTILATTQDQVWPGLAKSGSLIGSYTRNKVGYHSPAEYHISMRFIKFLSIIAREKVVLCNTNLTDKEESRWILMLKVFVKMLEIGFDNLDLESNSQIKSHMASVKKEPILIANPPLNSRPNYLSATSLQQLMHNPYLYYCKYILLLKSIGSPDQERVKDIYKREFGIVVHNTVAQIDYKQKLEVYMENFMVNAKREVDRLFFRRIIASNIIEQREYIFWMWEQKLNNIGLWLYYNEIELRKRFNITESLYEKKYSIIYHLDSSQESKETNSLKLEIVCDRVDFAYDSDGKKHIIITDYKTGVLPSNSDISNWDYPQLVFEGLILSRSPEVANQAKIMLRYLGLYGAHNKPNIEKWVNFDYEKNHTIIQEIIEKYYQKKMDYSNSGKYYDDEFRHILREI